MASEAESPAELALRVEKEILGLNGKRFLWSCDLRDHIIEDWKAHFELFQGLIETAHRAVVQLRAAGQTAEADRLALKMLSQERLQDPANFEIRVFTGYGFEKFTIVGSDEMQDTWDKRALHAAELSDTATGTTCHKPQPQHKATTIGVPCSRGRGPGSHEGEWDITRLLALAEPATVEGTWSDLPALSIEEVMQRGTWICYTKSGEAFCIECDCPRLMLPAVDSDKHDLVPRHFHTDPFQDDTALIHFLRVHREGFENGVSDMIQRHGRRVKNEGPDLRRLTVAAANLSAKVRYDHLLSMWSSWKDKYQVGGIRSQRSRAHRILQLDRWINTELFANDERPYTFLWPEQDGQLWTIICNHPECTSPFFSKHPLRKDRAIDHFRSHGLYLQDESEVLELFGFKVQATNQVTHMESTTVPVTEDLGGAANSVEEPDLILTPELFGGIVEYHRYSNANLYKECIRRHIPVTWTAGAQKEALIRKLKLSDGLPDFDDCKQWPINRLKSECRARGISENRKRDALVDQLWRHETKLRQQAFQKQQADMSVVPTRDAAQQSDRVEPRPVASNPTVPTTLHPLPALSTLREEGPDKDGSDNLDISKFQHLNPKVGAADEIRLIARAPLAVVDQNVQPKRGRPKKEGLETSITRPPQAVKGVDGLGTSIPKPAAKMVGLPVRSLPVRSASSLGVSRPSTSLGLSRRYETGAGRLRPLKET